MDREDKAADLGKWSNNSDIRDSPATDIPSIAPLLHQPSTNQCHENAPTAPTASRLPTHAQSQQKSFEFVLVTDNESRRQVRRHAMRNYMQQRRLDSIARLGAARVPAGWTARCIPDSYLQTPIGVDDTRGVSLEDTGSPSPDEEPSPQKKGKGSLRRVLPKPQQVEREDESLWLVPKQCPSPRTTPEHGAARDPFSSYPVPITDADHELIQHFVVTYPSMMYKFIDSPANNLNPMKEIFQQLALNDDLPFQAMLAIASKHRAGVEGKTESVQSLTHKMRALHLMNERIQKDSKGRNDGTIYAVATMAVIEKWSKDASIERMHFRGLASMIRNRGGMQAMQLSSPFLGKVLYWVDFSCAQKAIVGTALPWTGFLPDSPPTSFPFINADMHLPISHNSTAPQSTENLCEQYRACEDFLRFFRHLHQLESTALNSPSSMTAANSPTRRKTFIPGTKLHSILTLLPDYDHGIRDIRFIDEYTCMSCLFFLAVALYHSYTTSTSFDPYLQWLDNEVNSLNPYENPSITSILWLFLRNGGFTPDEEQDCSGARCWVVSRMVRIAKHLEWKRHGEIWDSLRAALIDFLVTQQECALGEESIDAEAFASRERKRGTHTHSSSEFLWDEDELRREMLDVKIPAQSDLDGLGGLGFGSILGSGDLNVPILT
ncbi:hypothetical protein BJX99DRAFT_221143 [Aspergillus californicus]